MTGMTHTFPQLTRRATGLPLCMAALLLCVAPGSSAAQGWLGFRSTLGHEWLTGDLAVPLTGGTRSEWSVFLHPSWMTVGGFQIRVGSGISRVTYAQRPGFPHMVASGILPQTHDSRWNHVRWHALIGIEYSVTSWFDVYIEQRRIWGRLRPQRHMLWDITDAPPQLTPYNEWDVSGWETVSGLKVSLGSIPLAIDVSFRSGDVSPKNASSFDLSEYGLGVRQDATASGFQIGVYWIP